MQNRTGRNLSALRVGCTWVATGCRQKKRSKAPFLPRRTKREGDDGTRKRCSSRSHLGSGFDARLLCAFGVSWSLGAGKCQCLGAAAPNLAVFWSAVAVVILVIVFPQVIASLIAR